jgi:hypothetical protein
MNPLGFVYLTAGLGLGILTFRLSLSMGWHWGLAIVLGLIPVVATFFFGLIGLLGAALFVGALYKATG